MFPENPLDIKDLLRSDYAPLPDAIQAIRNTIQKIEDGDDSSLTWVQTGERDQYLEYWRSILSPIRRLPTELLEKIFLLCSPGVIVGIQTTVEWQIGRVCSRWRMIITWLQDVWAAMRVLCEKESCKATHVARRCIALAGDRPLQLELNLTPNCRYKDSHANIFELFNAQRHRWMDVTLSMAFLELFQFEIQGVHGEFSSLRKLTIHGNNYVHFSRSAIRILAPQLIEINFLAVSYPTRLMRIPWHQIQCFSSQMSGYSRGEFSRILRRMGNIIRLETRFDFRMNGDDETDDDIHLPYLRSLTLSAFSPQHRIFRMLVTPVVTDLALSTSNVTEVEPRENPVDPLLTFLARPNLITTLILSGYNSADVCRIVRAVPTLQVLSLEQTADIHCGPILVELTVKAGSECVVPKLHTFSLVSLRTEVQLKDLVTQMVKSRTGHGADCIFCLKGCQISSLQHVQLKFPPDAAIDAMSVPR